MRVSKYNHFKGESELTGQDIVVPGDPSSAAFPMVAGILTEDRVSKLKMLELIPCVSGYLKS